MNNLLRVMCAVLVVGLSTMLADSASATKILYHGREDVPARGDIFAVAHLEAIYGASNVTYMNGSYAAADGSSADGYDVVVASSTMASSAVRGKYEDSPVGVVTWESALIRAADGANPPQAGGFFVSQDAKNIDGNSSLFPLLIDIVDSSHPLAAGLSGTVDVLHFNDITGDTGVQYGLLPLGAGVDQVATWTVGGEERQMIFGAEVGAALLGDGSPGMPATADGRRVMFFLSDYGFESLTADGLSLFDAAIAWAAVWPLPGDANRDRVVDLLDLGIVGDNWNGTGKDWATGDFNGDDIVDLLDLGIVGDNWGGSLAESAGAAEVPEPSSLSMIAMLGLGGAGIGACKKLKRKEKTRK